MRLRRNRAWHRASLYLALVGASMILPQGVNATTTLHPLATSTHVSKVAISTHTSTPAAGKTATLVKKPVVAAKPAVTGNANHILISTRGARKLTAAQLNQLSTLAGQKLRVESNQGHGQYLLRLPKMTNYSSVQTMSARMKRSTALLDAVPTQIASTKYMVVKAGHPISINGSSITPNATNVTGYHWQQIRGRAVQLASTNRSATSFYAPHRIVRKNAARACDPTTDPTCTSTTADPSLTCDPSIDPTCGVSTTPSATCDPTTDPTCSGAPASTDPSLVCDPTVDPTCGTSSPSATCDPTVDPTCSGSSPSASCDPTVDPTCGGSSPSASCDPTVDPTCGGSSTPAAAAPVGNCGATTINSIRRNSVKTNSLFGTGSGGLGGLLGGLNLGGMLGGMQPSDASGGNLPGLGSSDPTAGGSFPSSGGSSSDPTAGGSFPSSGGSSSDPTAGGSFPSSGGSSSDPTAGGSFPSSGGSSSNPFGNLFGGGLFGQIMQDINQLFVDINQFMCSMQSSMSNMPGASSGVGTQSVRKTAVRDNANVLGFRLMTTDKAGHNILHRVYVHVVPNIVKKNSVKKPVATVKKPVKTVKKPAVITKSPLVRK